MEGQKYRFISYIWDTNAPLNTIATEGRPGSPVKVLVVESGNENLGQWIHYQRNILADYERLYQSQPTRILGISLQTNCQHTDAHSEGYFGELVFSARSR
jgi:alpha-amylase/alpha-mannosidase (GH57 family)